MIQLDVFRDLIRKQQEFANEFGNIIRKAYQQLEESIPDFKFLQDFLYHEGWYVGGSLPVPDVSNLADMVRANHYAKVELALVSWARDESERIIDRASSQHIERSAILDAAFRAHSRGEYELSIPVFLAQADGIAIQFGGSKAKLFSPEFKRIIEKRIDKLNDFKLDWISDMILGPLRLKNIFVKSSASPVTPGGITLPRRHDMLHGLQTDYASESNSLRVIVHIGYILWAIDCIKSHEAEAMKCEELFNREGDALHLE